MITTHQIGGPSPFPIIKDFRLFLIAGAPRIKPTQEKDK